MVLWLPWIVVLVATALAAVTDVRLRRIPNWLTFPLLIGGFAWQVLGGGLLGGANGLGGCLIAAIPFGLLFVFAGGGAGDCKLMGAAGAWLGFSHATLAVVTVTAVGGLLAILFAMWTGRLYAALRNLGVVMWLGASALCGQGRLSEFRQGMPPTTAMQPMPYGLAIFLGVTAAATLTYCHWPAWRWM